MNYLLDTNLVSELMKKEPNRGVLRWIDERDEDTLYLSVLTFGELQKGISKLADPIRSEKLKLWVEKDLKERFQDRTISIDLEIALTWGILQGASEKQGTKLPVMDSLIAATAIVHNLIVVT